ncbi:MAG: histidine kinase [Cytophagales bacterium]|nr:histidine kinase [Cytophagales bacterium]
MILAFIKELIHQLPRRFILKLLLGSALGVMQVVQDMQLGCPNDKLVIVFFANVIGTFFIWSGSEATAFVISKKYNWQTEPVKKALIMVLCNIAYLNICLVIIFFTISRVTGREVQWQYFLDTLFTTLLITTIINLIFVIIDIYKYWKSTIYEIEMLKQENLRSQLESLKNQVNPHFLFNSLNTLISVIDEDPEVAKTFTQNLSQVYRYILQAKEKDTIALGEELQFIKSYNYLLKIRYNENLHFKIDVSKSYDDTSIPTLVLQMLIENCIKHNIISAAKPLHVHIYVEHDKYIAVSNNLQLKKIQVESNKVGLKNIMERYKLLGKHDIEIIQSDTHFTVLLPLI